MAAAAETDVHAAAAKQLEAALAAFSAETEGDVCFCDKCGENTNVDCSTVISRLPPVLTVGFKRLRINLTTHKRFKDKSRVALPLILDMAPFATAGASAGASTSYRCVAVVNHFGRSFNGGHYITHACRDGAWAVYDDNKVAAPVPFAGDVRGNSHLLVYVREDCV